MINELIDPRLKNDVQFRQFVELAIRDPRGLKKRIDAEWCCRDHGLLKFVRLMWRFVEPSRPFIEGWHLDAVCEHLEAVTRGEITRLLINVPPGFAKPVNVDTFVLTERNGRKRLGDIVVGDRVLTHRGRYCTVSAVHEQGVLPLLAVKTHTGREVLAAPEHPFLTTVGWVAAQDLTIDHVLANVVPREGKAGTCTLTPEAARFLGYLVGDGSCKYLQVSFTNADEAVLADFEHCAASLGFVTRRWVRAGCIYSYVIVKSVAGRWRGAVGRARSPLRHFLNEHGLQGKGSYEKCVPPAVLAGTDEIIAEFIGAYWSCDGFVQKKGVQAGGLDRPDIVAGCDSVNRELLVGVQHLLLRLGVNARLRQKSIRLESKRQPGGRYISYTLQLTSFDQVSKFAQRIRLAHTEKQAKLAQTRRITFDRCLYEDRVISVTPAGAGACRCLTVEDDCSFTANDVAVHNSITLNVFWPAWEWGPRNLPSNRFMSASYSQDLTLRDNVRFRHIILSDLYQEHWSGSFQPSKDVFSLTKVGNDKTGWKLATSVGGLGTGERADRVCIDDPNSVKEVESDKVRDSTNQWLTEVVPTRLNDPSRSAIIIIQQRTHEEDASGTVLSREMGYEHLMIPMRYDSARRYVTVIGWTDPRGVDADGNEVDADGTLAWPELYPEKIVTQLEKDLGPYATAGQLQQLPVPRGGAIFERDWWKPWWIDGDAKIRFPQFEYVVASVDTAFTEKQQNDFSAMTVWGVYRQTGVTTLLPRDSGDPSDMMRVAQDERPKVMLMWGWQKRLSLHGPPEERPNGVTEKEWNSPEWLPQRQKSWGLVEWVVYTAQRYRIDQLLIETQAAGHSLEQELRRLHQGGDWGVQLINAKGDKTARAYAVQHLFSNGLIYAPMYPDTGAPPVWGQTVIDQFSTFPKTRYKDLVDSGTHALQHLRDIGVLVRGEEHDASFEETMRLPGRKKALYEV